jgi:hypothetical protein
MTEAPFSRKGGIETAFGRGNRDIIGDFLNREFTIVPENPERTELALQNPLLTPFEDTMRRSREGVILVSFLRRSQDTNAPKNTLVERWAAFADPVNNDSAFDAERALREHVAGSYLPGGQQYDNRTLAFKQANVILNRLQEGRLNGYQSQQLIASTRKVMSRYFSSPIPERLKTAQQFVKALEVDSSGRPNQPAGRVIVTAGRRPIIEDRLVDDVIVIKNLHRASLIDTECGFEDVALSQSAKLARFAASINDDRAFNLYLDDKFLPNMHYLLSPDTIAIKPYSNLAAKLRFLLFAKKDIDGVSDDDISMGLARYIGNEAYEFYDKHPFFTTLITAKQRKERLEEFSGLCDGELEEIRNLRANPPKKEPKVKRDTNENAFWKRLKAF